MKAIIDAQDRKIKSLEKSIQLKDLSLAEADLKIQVCETRITGRQVFLFFPSFWENSIFFYFVLFFKENSYFLSIYNFLQ